MKDHVLVSVVRVGERIVVHAYGPYTKEQAQRERRLVSSTLPRECIIKISACKVIDIDKMNEELETETTEEDSDMQGFEEFPA